MLNKTSTIAESSSQFFLPKNASMLIIAKFNIIKTNNITVVIILTTPSQVLQIRVKLLQALQIRQKQGLSC